MIVHIPLRVCVRKRIRRIRMLMMMPSFETVYRRERTERKDELKKVGMACKDERKDDSPLNDRTENHCTSIHICLLNPNRLCT